MAKVVQDEAQGKVTDADRARLRRLEVTLDQRWDLLRQRRARRARVSTRTARTA
jgi:hypothetical protein